MPSVRQQKKDLVRQSIINSAFNLFQEHGYNNVSVNDIIKDAKIAKGTFFNYFPTKADLLAFWYSALIKKSISISFEPHLDLEANLLRIIEVSVQFIRANPNIWLEKNIHVLTNKNLQAIERDSETTLRNFVIQFLTDSNQQLKISHNQFADLFVTLFTGTVREWAITGQETDIAAIFSQRLHIFLQISR